MAPRKPVRFATSLQQTDASCDSASLFGYQFDEPFRPLNLSAVLCKKEKLYAVSRLRRKQQ